MGVPKIDSMAEEISSSVVSSSSMVFSCRIFRLWCSLSRLKSRSVLKLVLLEDCPSSTRRPPALVVLRFFITTPFYLCFAFWKISPRMSAWDFPMRRASEPCPELLFFLGLVLGYSFSCSLLPFLRVGLLSGLIYLLFLLLCHWLYETRSNSLGHFRILRKTRRRLNNQGD